jgi:hypothetical protein
MEEKKELKIKKTTLFRVLAILIIGEALLPIVFENIYLPFLGLVIAWFLLLLLIHPKVLISKSHILIYLFILIYAILMFFGVYNIDYNYFIGIIPYLFLPISMYSYFLYIKDYRGLAFTVLVSLIFIFITSITSIFGLINYPNAARQLAGILVNRGGFDLINLYRKIGIGGYDFFAGIAFLFPVLIYQFKCFNQKTKLKYAFLSFLIVLFLSLIFSKYTTAFLIALAGIFFAFFARKNLKKSLIVFTLIFIFLFIIPTNFYANTMYRISCLFEGTRFEGTIIQERLTDFSATLQRGLLSGTTHTSFRFGRIPILLGNFIKSPLFGVGESLGHQFWFDILSFFGLIGILPWVFIIKHQIKNNLNIFKKSFKTYYILSISLFIFFGFVNNMGQKILFLSAFFIIPGIYFLTYLRKAKKL